MLALILLGCAAPLLSGEEVLGIERSATFIRGGEGDHLGASIAAAGDSWLATAPGAGTTWRDGEIREGAAQWIGWWGGAEVVATAEGEVSVDGEPRWRVPGGVAYAAGPGGVVAATGSTIRLLDRGVDIEVEGAESVAIGAERVIGLVCAGDACAARAWSFAGVDLGEVAVGGPGGAVAEWRGVAWAGAPAWDDPEATGQACSEEGRCVDGLPGDHLGAALGGGHTAGTFNKWVVPARARLVPLEGGPVLVLEEGAELQPILLSGDEGLFVGVPYMPAHGVPSGAVVRVDP